MQLVQRHTRLEAVGERRLLVIGLQDAREVGNFVLYKLMVGLPSGGAYIPEWYDEHWKPLKSRDKGGFTDIGHQCEWVHLLRTAEKRGLLVYYDVDDIDAHVAKVRDSGGEAEDKMPVPSMGWFSQCKDPEGNSFGLWQTDSSAPVPEG